MNRWWTFIVAALLVAAVPATRYAIAQAAPAAEPDAEHEAWSVGDEGAGFEDWLALDTEPAQMRGEGMRRPAVGTKDLRDRLRGRGEGLRALATELNLTAAQKDRLEAVRDQHHRKAIAMRADLQVAMLDMRKLMRADSPDRRAIEAQIDRTAAMRADLHKARVAALLDARAILTPQQREKLKELRGAHGLMGDFGRGGMRPGRHGGHGLGEDL